MESQRLVGTRVVIFACPDTDSFSARCQNRGGGGGPPRTPLAVHTAAFERALVMLLRVLALCFEESKHFTCRVISQVSNPFGVIDALAAVHLWEIAVAIVMALGGRRQHLSRFCP
jgi:hypothetical protein